MKNTIFLILTSLFIIFLNSCRTKQLVTQTLTTTVRDTIRDIRTVEKFKAVHDTLTITNPCDSNGILTTFYSKVRLPQGQVIIRSYKGNIKATIDLDSISNVYDLKYKSKYNQEVKLFEKEVVRNVVPTWAIVTIFFESLIIIGYLYFRFINPFR
jgi:hypothetical protein